MGGSSSVTGDQTIYHTDNMCFDGTDRGAPMALDGQLWIGATSSNRPNNGGHVRLGSITSPDASVTIGYISPNITLQVSGGSTVGKTITGNTGGALLPTAGNWNIFGTSTAAGTSPVNTSGAGSTLTINVQTSQALAAADATKIGLANFDSAAFDVSATGFVQLNGGGIAATAFDVQANTAPGTDPVVPTAAGVVAINGAAVANHSVVLETRSRAANAYNLEVQYSASAASTDATKSGVAHFNSAQFTVDASGFVSSSGAMSDYHLARYIVSAGGATDGANYTTLATAYAAAVAAGAPQTVGVQPGTYTENITLTPGINICALPCDASLNEAGNVKIIGKLTLTTAGTVSISGVQLQTNSDFVLAVTGSAASVVNLMDCELNFTNNTGISFTASNANSGINIYRCKIDLGTTLISYFSSSSTGTINMHYCHGINSGNSVTASTISAGVLNMHYSTIRNPITSSGTAGVSLQSSRIQMSGLDTTCLTIGGSTTNVAYDCVFIADNATAVVATSVFPLSGCTIYSTATNAISGAGTLSYGDIRFTGSSSLITTTTQVPLVSTNDAVKIKSPGAYPYTTVPQDGVILVDSSSARTIVPLASPTTGQMHRIKDNVGSAAANNITITPSGKNIDGAASLVINTNYGSVDIVYNGTQWNAL